LGAEPILLGSSKEAHIYLRKDKGFPPITAKIYIENKDIILDFDQAMQQMKGLKVLRHRLRNGERRKIGDVLLEIKTSERNSPS
jgi:Ca-activated chloride channel family protein